VASAEDVRDLLQQVTTAISADDSASETAALTELGWALIAEGQMYLAGKDAEDEDFFFEVYGYPRGKRPDAWVAEILGGLGAQLDPDEVAGIRDRAVTRAVRQLSGRA
jgi:hypothetical protein